MKDPLRPNVSKCVKYARDQGHLSIRMISGDHIETAKQVAIKAGILRPEEAGRSYAVMTGAQFRTLLEDLPSKRERWATVLNQCLTTLEASRRLLITLEFWPELPLKIDLSL